MPKVIKPARCMCGIVMDVRKHFVSPDCLKTPRCFELFAQKGLMKPVEVKAPALVQPVKFKLPVPIKVKDLSPVEVKDPEPVQAMEEESIEGPWLIPSSEPPEEYPNDQATQMVIDAIAAFSSRKTEPEGMTFCIDYHRPPGCITLCSQMGSDNPANLQVDCYYEDVKWDYILWFFGPDRKQARVIHRMRPRDGHFFVVSDSPTLVRFDPLAKTGHCEFCKLIQPYPCENPECVELREAAEKKTAESFADNVVAEVPVPKAPPKPRRQYRKRQKPAPIVITTQEQVREYVDKFIKRLEDMHEGNHGWELHPKEAAKFAYDLCPDPQRAKVLQDHASSFYYYMRKSFDPAKDYAEFHTAVCTVFNSK